MTVSSSAYAAEPSLPELTARAFFSAVLRADIDGAARLCADPVNFDGESASKRAQILNKLRQMSDRARTKRLRIRALQVLTTAEMTKRFGKPPRRLRKSVGSRDLIALVAFDKRGAIAVLRKTRGVWRVHAVSD